MDLKILCALIIDSLNDDNGPDRPSCQMGIMNRLFRFFSAHPFSINGGFIDTTTQAARAPLTIETATEEVVQFTSMVINEKINAYAQGRDHLRDLYEEWRADPSENEELDGILGFTDADRARFDTHMTATYPDWATAGFKSNLMERLNNQVYYLNDITHDIIQNLLRRSPGSSPSL